MRKGITRICFKFYKYAIKLPNPFNGHQNFLEGCLSNCKERNFYKNFKDFIPHGKLIAPSYFCSIFGIVQIQGYCTVLTRDLTDSELREFDPVRGGESKRINFGYFKGSLVCLDYG